MIAVDQPNIRFGGAMAIAKAANGFIDRLLPSDRVAVAGIGLGAPATSFTADRARVKQAIARMVGQKTPELREHAQHRAGRGARDRARRSGRARTGGLRASAPG